MLECVNITAVTLQLFPGKVQTVWQNLEGECEGWTE